MADGLRRKLLWVGDAGVSTGFARATHQVLDVLRATWDISVLGVNYYGEPHPWPYPMWPARNVGPGGGDWIGVSRVPELITKIGPDVMVVLTDPWHVPHYLKAAGNVPTVGWLAVDGKNCRGTGLNGLKAAVFWTAFGVTEARAGGYSGPTAVVPLGVDLDRYHPQSQQAAREIFRAHVFGPRFPVDGFIVGVVGRNQPRKRLDLTIAYFAEWIQTRQVRDAYLFLHVAPTGEDAYDLDQLGKYFGISNRVILMEPLIGQGVDEQKLAETYATFDVMLTTTQGEGWGLCHQEAMACGIPNIVPDWAALGEWPEEAALKVPCTAIAVTTQGINVIGGVPDRDATIAALDRLYRDPAARADLRARGLAVVSRPEYRWPAIGQAFAEVLDEALTPEVPRPGAGQELSGVRG